MPVPLQKAFGTALRSVQLGGTPGTAKPLKGFGGAGVLELVEDYDRGTYRAANVWRQIEAAGVPGVKGVWSHEAGGSRMWLTVSITQMYPGSGFATGSQSPESVK